MEIGFTSAILFHTLPLDDAQTVTIGDLSQKRFDQGGFANAWLARDENDVACTVARLL